MSKFKVGDKVAWSEAPGYGTGTVISEQIKASGGGKYQVRFDGFDEYDDSEWPDHHTPFERDLELVEAKVEDNPESPNHYTRLKALTGVETWDILDFVAGEDPDMWNLGKYWFRMGHKEGQSTLTEKKKMLKYLERSIEKEESTTE